MSCAYDEIYLSDAMCNLGEMLEYAHDACAVEAGRALHYFVVSGYAARFAVGDPAVVSGLSGTELYIRAAEECGDKPECWPEALIRYETEEYYWLGYILACFQWTYGLAFERITHAIDPDELLAMYPALHTASEAKAVDVIYDLYRSRNEIKRLREYRRRMGLTQAALAERAGVNLRTLQQYETGAKQLNKAAADTVFALASVLGCAPVELIS